MTRDQLDSFLYDATHRVAQMWEERSGQELTTDELYALNDCLTAHFPGTDEANIVQGRPRGTNYHSPSEAAS